MVDGHGRLEEVNETYCRMSGYSAEELLTMHIADLDAGETAEETSIHIQKIIAQGEDRFESKHRRKDGKIIDVEISVQYRPAADGQLVAFIRDITGRNRIEGEQRKLQLQQAQKMEAIGTQAGGIAHDFNNIIGAILGYAEMARDDSPAGSMVAHDLDQVIIASSRAKELVRQILAFSRQAETEQLPVQPALLVKESLKLLRSSLPTTIAIDLDIDTDCGVIVADPTQIHQLLMNLCTNAFHAMEATGGTLTVTVKKKVLNAADLVNFTNVHPGNFVRLSIRDTGAGIPQATRDRIFDPYFTTKETGKDTGMGLAIVHGIVASYGGFITCESQLGVGSVFHIHLPGAAAGDLPPTKPAEAIPGGSERILFVDDEEILADMGRAMLVRLGYRVTVRTSSLEALTTFKNQLDAFDLVITDQTMPVMTGIDLARRILQLRPGLPILLCTGYSPLLSEEKARAIGVKGLVLKPLSKKTIATVIRDILDDKKLPG